MAEKQHDIILVARDTWSDLWRRRQYLASEFARTGRVLFVEAPFSVPRLLAGSPDMAARPRERLFDAFTPPRRVAENLYVAAPLKPVPDNPPALAAVNRAIQTMQLRRAAASAGLRAPVLWLNPEYAVWMTGALEHGPVVYDVTDGWTHAASLPARELARIRRDDALMLQRADIVFTVSHDLFAKKKPLHPNVVLMPNGVRPGLYDISAAPRPPELQGIDGPIAGYTGSLHTDRIDPDLIEYLSRSGAFTQVFVGPNYLDASTNRRLAALRNVRLIPAQPYHRLPAFVFHFDVCSIPHAVTDFTHSLDPIKAYEYLAAGKPIVCTAVRGMAPLASFAHIMDNYESYGQTISRIIAGHIATDAAALKAESRKHSWSARAKDILGHIENLGGGNR
jgi:glycosyltransferase involved in cell wall biosynthesis